jgi:hypothetical protein
MAQKAKAGGVFQVRCTCGRDATVDAVSFGKPLRCGACRSSTVIVWGIDPKSKKAAPMILETSAAEPRGFRLPDGMQELPCPCGQRLYARPRQAGKRVQCPVCATWLKLEQSRDPQTLETRIRVVKSRLNQLPAVPSQAAPEAGPNVQQILCSCGESLSIEPARTGNQAQCPACGTLMRLVIRKDAASSYVVVDPASADPAQPAEKRGIDEELSLDDFT